MQKPIKRREFIRQSGLGTLGLSFLPYLPNKVAPGDTLRVAHIGVGGMGNARREKFRGDRDANRLLDRENRREWNLV